MAIAENSYPKKFGTFMFENFRPKNMAFKWNFRPKNMARTPPYANMGSTPPPGVNNKEGNQIMVQVT